MYHRDNMVLQFSENKTSYFEGTFCKFCFWIGIRFWLVETIFCFKLKFRNGEIRLKSFTGFTKILTFNLFLNFSLFFVHSAVYLSKIYFLSWCFLDSIWYMVNLIGNLLEQSFRLLVAPIIYNWASGKLVLL